MAQNPKISTVMTPFPYTVGLDAPILVAQRLMDEHGMRHLPVRDESKKLVGVISDRDVSLALSVGSEFMKQEDIIVEAAYTPAPYVADVGTDLTEVLKQMVERHIGSALITKNEKLVGIFTSTDACRVLRTQLLKNRGTTPSEPEAA